VYPLPASALYTEACNLE